MQKKQNDTDMLGKIPPQNIDIEICVLGALLLENESYMDVSSILKPDIFYKQEHQYIYTAIYELNKENKPADILSVTERLRKNGKLEEVGGAYYIVNLTSSIASSRSIIDHSYILKEAYIRREIIKTSSEIVNNGFDSEIEIDELLDLYNKNNELINDNINSFEKSNHISNALQESSDNLVQRSENYINKKINGIPTHLRSLDRIIFYWPYGEFIVIAARPSIGKTQHCLKIAKTAALNGNSVCIYSLETDAVKLSDRLLLSETSVSLENFRSGNLNAKDWGEIDKAIGRLSKLPIYIDDDYDVSIDHIKSHSKYMKKQNKCDMIIIDYLQLAESGLGKNTTREREVSYISRELKKLAKRLKIPIIALSQLNREIERRGGDKRPLLSDIKDSGSIEQDAFVIIFIHVPEKVGILEDENGMSTKNMGELIVAKHKDGPTGVAKFKQIDGGRLIYDEEDEFEPVFNQPSFYNKDSQYKDGDLAF